MSSTISIRSTVSKRKTVKRRATRARTLLGVRAVRVGGAVDPPELRSDEPDADGRGDRPPREREVDPEPTPASTRRGDGAEGYVRVVEIVELSPEDVRAAADELAGLLLDAHASNMALGLSGPLTAERARAAWLDTAARLEPGRRVLLAALEGSAVVGTVQVVRADADNGGHRAEIVRLAVRGDRRGSGLGTALLDAAVERARSLGLRLLWLTTHAETASDRFYAGAGWTRLGVLPEYSARPDGTLAGSALYYRLV